jgi:hypothetical protein
VIRIGTRALICIDGKPLLATHWDGYPSCLGLALLNCDKTVPAIVEVAIEHTIDAAGHTILKELSRHRIKALAKKHRLTQKEIKARRRRGCVICAEDYEISSIENYGDWAEYQYDIRGQEVYFRPLVGFYPKSVNRVSRFKLLTKEAAKKD